MKKRGIVTLTAVASLICAGALCAEEGGVKPEAEIAPRTPAKEGGVKPEAAERAPLPRAIGFTEADADGNGSLSLEEYKTMHARQLEAMKARMGGRFNEERMAKMGTAEAKFATLDADANGSVTKEEFVASRRKPRQRRGKIAPPAQVGAGAPDPATM